MKLSLVIGGSLKGSFVLYSKDLVNIRLKTEDHTCIVWFHNCPQFSWFITNYGHLMEDESTIWGQGVEAITFSGNKWCLHVDTNYIPVTLSPE